LYENLYKVILKLTISAARHNKSDATEAACKVVY